jgi:hypothetical protein
VVRLDEGCNRADLRFLHNTKNSATAAKTYNSGDSLVITHLTTNLPVSCLNRAE